MAYIQLFPFDYKAIAQAIANTFGIGHDYIEAGDGIRYADNGEDCTHTKGVMGNIETIRRVTRWSRCSLEDLEKYIQDHGGNNFCLHSFKLTRASECAGKKQI